MKRSLKQIFKYKNCIGVLNKNVDSNNFFYLPTNDMGLYFEIMSLPSEEVDKVDIISKIYISKTQYIVYIEVEDSCYEGEYSTMEEAIKDIKNTCGE